MGTLDEYGVTSTVSSAATKLSSGGKYYGGLLASKAKQGASRVNEKINVRMCWTKHL